MIELKLCPFCGSEAKMVLYRDLNNEAMQRGFILCTNGHCAMSGNPWSDVRNEKNNETAFEAIAIERWNTRTSKSD